MYQSLVIASASVFLLVGCAESTPRLASDPRLRFSGEIRLTEIRELTHGGLNLAPQWSPAGGRILFAHTGVAKANPTAGDGVFEMRTDGTDWLRLSPAEGPDAVSRATYLPGGDRIVYGVAGPSVTGTPLLSPPSAGAHAEQWTVRRDGSDKLRFEPAEPKGYSAQPAVCGDGSVLFSSDRDGDFELYRGRYDSLGTLSDVARVTRRPGFEGWPAFSPDCLKIAWEGARPGDGGDSGIVEIWTADANGLHPRQLTNLGVQSRSPVFLPDGQGVLFSANLRDRVGGKADLYVIRLDGTGLEQVSFSGAGENYPAFSPDGRTLAFVSGRDSADPGAENIFLADWNDVGTPSAAPAEGAPATRIRATIGKLQAPDFVPREAGSPALPRAEEWVAARFAELGLAPYGADSGYFQPLELSTGHGSRVAMARNVVGSLGDDCGHAAALVVTARLDHDAGTDGTATGALLELARTFASPATPPESSFDRRRSCVVFAAVEGGADGLAGPYRLLAYLKDRKTRIKAMVSIEGVGGVEEARLPLAGAETAAEWEPALTLACDAERLACLPGSGSQAALGAGGTLPFYLTGLPVLRMSAASERGVTPNFTGAAQAVRVLTTALASLAPYRQTMHFQKSAVFSLLEPPAADVRSAYLGLIPDYAAVTATHRVGAIVDPTEHGVRLAGAHPGSPAAAAGVKAGDLLFGVDLVGKDPRKIGSLEDLMDVLRAVRPGDRLVLHLKRGGQDLVVQASLGERDE